MPSPLVRTKLYVPQVRRGLVARPRLSERLNRTPHPAVDAHLRAPGLRQDDTPGRVAGRRDGCGSSGGLGLPGGDRAAGRRVLDLRRHRSGHRGAGRRRGALPLLQTANPPIDTVLATVLNELSALPGGLSLVLDDYHLADGPAIADDMASCWSTSRRTCTLVISTRADPALPLARLRARGELVEVRAADLRFTPRRGGGVPERGRRAGPGRRRRRGAGGAHRGVDRRRCSWRRSRSRGATTSAGFIAGFAGDDRYVVDYLVEEVLARQPDAVRRFLLETSILDRLSGSLCDAVTGGDDGKSVLELLDRSNLFVVPLDDQPPVVPLPPPLRRRPAHASARGAARGARRPAPPRRPVVRRGRGARCLRSGTRSRPVTSSGRPSWSSWRSRVSAGTGRRPRSGAGSTTSRAEVVRVRPVLAVGFIGALMSSREFEGVEAPARRRGAAARARTRRPGRWSCSTRTSSSGCPAAIETYRAALALVRGDPSATVVHADRAIARAVDDDHLSESAASALSGLATWASGDLEAAHQRYSAAVEGLRAGRALLGRARLLDHARRPPDHPGTSRRCPTYLRGRAGAARLTSRTP